MHTMIGYLQCFRSHHVLNTLKVLIHSDHSFSEEFLLLGTPEV